jgi:uncharacterized protein (DUF305 family)
LTKHPTRRRAAVAAVATVLSLALAPAVSAADGPVPQGTANSASQGLKPLATSPAAYELGEELAELSGKELEITYLAAIIPHHRSAVEMAELELRRGTDARVRATAEGILTGQRLQLVELTHRLHQWYGLTPKQAREKAPEEAREEIDALESDTRARVEELRRTPAGKGFDAAFVRRVIPHHSAGIVQSLEAQARAVHPELREAARTGISAQQAEIDDFRAWLAGHKK